MPRTIVIKVYLADMPGKWDNIQDENLQLISHQELPFDSNTDRNIHTVLKNLARWLCEKRGGENQ